MMFFLSLLSFQRLKTKWLLLAVFFAHGLSSPAENIFLRNDQTEPKDFSSVIKQQNHTLNEETSLEMRAGVFVLKEDKKSYLVQNMSLVNGATFYCLSDQFKVNKDIDVEGSNLYVTKKLTWEGVMTLKKPKNILEIRDSYLGFFINAQLRGGELSIKEKGNLVLQIYNRNQMVEVLKSGEPLIELTGSLKVNSAHSSLVLIHHKDFEGELMPGSYPLIKAAEIHAENLNLSFDVPPVLAEDYVELNSDQKSKVSLEIKEGILFLEVKL